MALGLILRVSWICFLLFDCSAGVPALKGYGYPYKEDSQNMVDHGEDEEFTSPTSDQSDGQASDNQPTGPVYMYNPSAAQWPGWVMSQQNLPNTPSAPEAERLLNGAVRNWGWENPWRPLVFPLSPNYQPSDPAKHQPGQHQSVDDASTNTEPASPAGVDEPEPTSTSEAAESPDGGNDVAEDPNQDLNADSSGGDQSSAPHLVYEDVFEYPPENTEPSSNTEGGYSQDNYISKGSSTAEGSSLPSNPTNVAAQPVYPSGEGSPSSEGEPLLNVGQTDYQSHDENLSLLPLKKTAEEDQVTQRVSEPIIPPPPPPPPRYIIQSRNGYQQANYRYSKTRYSPEFLPSIPVSSKSDEGQPAAPVKNSQRARW